MMQTGWQRMRRMRGLEAAAAAVALAQRRRGRARCAAPFAGAAALLVMMVGLVDVGLWLGAAAAVGRWEIVQAVRVGEGQLLLFGVVEEDGEAALGVRQAFAVCGGVCITVTFTYGT